MHEQAVLLTFASEPVLCQHHSHAVTSRADQLVGYVLHIARGTNSAVLSAVLTSIRVQVSSQHVVQNNCRMHHMRRNAQHAACTATSTCRCVQARHNWQKPSSKRCGLGCMRELR